ncbi:MAG: hypothetical protein ACR2KH_03965 [Sphingomicrobium sp.]
MDMQFARPWSIIQPRVYRFLEQQYVDQFFEDGTLLLSSFERFAKHRDEQRKDENEGKGVRTLTGPEFTAVMATGRGHDCYVLCGSTANTDTIRKCFSDADGCLAIDNPLQFANLVSSHVPAFAGGFAGHCIYQDKLEIRRHSESASMENLMPQSLEDLQKLADAAGGIEELFLKHAQFAGQSEYRMLWRSNLPIQDPLIIKCPEARSACRRL